MPPDAVPSIPVTAVGLARAAVRLWRSEGGLQVTVVIKGTFRLVPGAAMLPAAPEELLTAELHHQNNPVRSIRVTGDLAPALARADVVLTGHAFAPPGREVREMAVRLAVFRERPLLNKVIRVRGDVKAKGGEPAPFQRMPLVYERAYGGIGFEDNPLGVGAEQGDTRSPNLVHPADERRVACFAPISRAWPARKRLLGGADRRALDAAIAEIPAGFDRAYFNAAPLDQQVEELRGEEWILLDGMHPTHAQVQSYLPYARGLARVRGLAGAGVSADEPVALRLDTLRIDADELLCTAVWRGSFPVPDEGALAKLRIEAGIETYGRPVQWPAEGEPRQETTLSFDVSEVRDDAAEEAEDVTDLAQTIAPDEAEPALTTLTLDDREQREAAAHAIAPFHAPAQAAPAPPPPMPPEELILRGDTLSMEERPPPPSLPFQRPATAVPVAVPVPVSVSVSAPVPAPAKQRPQLLSDLRLLNDTPLRLAVRGWDLRPARACLTVIAEATCDLVPGGPAELRAPSAEAGPADGALFKVRADVALTGHAYAPGGEAREASVRFAFGHEGNRFDRELLVFGARAWVKGVAGLKPSAPEPFTRIPLGYESAYGGPGYEPNPVGVGRFDPLHPPGGPGRPAPLPHLEDPARRLRTPRQEPPPASFSPAKAAWKGKGPAAARPRAPGRAWPFLPEDLDWTYYQVAPASQQLAFLDGDEPFAIEGCHPRHERIEGSLPGVRARAVVLRGSGAIEELPLRLDTVVLDADALSASLVWRGLLTIPDEKAPDVDAILLVTGEATLEEARTRLLRR